MPRKIQGYGWIPDLPDQRDHLFLAAPELTQSLPPSVDLRPQCPPVYDQGQLGSCHDDQTEALTDRGWMLFRDLTGAERLATVDPATTVLSFERPTRLVRFPYEGPLYCMDNDSLNFAVTPDHMMLVRPWDERARQLSKHYRQVRAADLGWYSGLLSRVTWHGENASDTYTLPGVAHKHRPQREPLTLPMTAWLRFLGLYLAEGTMVRSATSHYKVQLAASKPREKAFIRETLTALGIGGLELGDRFTFDNRRIYEHLAALGLLGVRASEKFVPPYVFWQSASSIRAFLLGHFMGDGCLCGRSPSHYTSSARLADDLQTLIFLSGANSYLSTRAARASKTADGRTVTGRSPEHRVSVREHRNVSINRKQAMFTRPYSREVFCAEMPTHHTLVTRRRGRILVSGNCTANSIAAAIEFDLMKQRGAQVFTPSRLFIYYNERDMEGTVNSDSGAQIRDGIKSVANLGDCNEDLWPYDITKFTEKPPDSCYQAALQTKVTSYQRINRDLNQMKGCLAAGYPFVLGFSVYESFESPEVAKSGQLSMPQPGEQLIGGHAVMAVGYDDGGQHFIIRNSWGPKWGMQGYFTMPYPYLTQRNLSSDFWTVRMIG